MLRQLYISGMKPSWLWWVTFLCALELFTSILLRILHICSSGRSVYHFFSCVFFWSWHQSNTSFVKWCWLNSLISILWSFEKHCCELFEDLVGFYSESIWIYASLVGRFGFVYVCVLFQSQLLQLFKIFKNFFFVSTLIGQIHLIIHLF